MMKSESIKELATALAKAQQEIKGAHKDADNPFFKSKYADLASVWDACQEALNKNGLSIVQGPQMGLSGYYLETRLLHISGEWIESCCPLINPKNDMQGLGSAISYARRFSLAAICGVVAVDDDAEGTKVESKTESTGGNTFIDKNKACTPAQAKLIQTRLDLAKLNGLDAAKILNKYGSHLPERIPFSKVNDVLADIEAHAKRRHPSEPPDVIDDMNVDRIFKK